jgi:hypothetical protein
MLHYFSSQDPLISHTLARRFFWSEYILWKEDVKDLPMSVTLSGKDLIVPTDAVWKYLTSSEASEGNEEPDAAAVAEVSPESRSGWTSGSLRVLWFNDFDHAGLFSSKGARRGVSKIIQDYSNAG